jgi:Uncharacterized conserved protein
MEAFFLAKKVITFFVEPLGLILTLNLIGLYFLYKSAYKKSKLFLSSALFLLLFFSYPPVGNFLIQQLESQYTKYSYKDTNIEFIHVLGSGHHENNLWPLSSQIGNASLKRTLEGVTIYKKLNRSDTKLIFTGYAGSNNKIPNAEMNARIAQIVGINNYNIIINGKPKDTKEESIFTKSIVNNRPFILVTSASHMPRAIKLFKDSGLNPIAAPTDFKGKNISFLSLPNIGSLEKSRNAMHELLGIAWAYLVR